VTIGGAAKQASLFERVGSLWAGRHLARFLKGVRRACIQAPAVRRDFLHQGHTLFGVSQRFVEVGAREHSPLSTSARRPQIACLFLRGLIEPSFWIAFKLLDPAVALPKLNVVTVDHFAGAFPCTVVVIADEIDGFHETAVMADEVCSIVRHDRCSLTRAI
jgi:hypothetical protein